MTTRFELGARVRHVRRFHAAWFESDGSEVEHAAAPGTDSSMCGLKHGGKYRHRFEDVSRRNTCPRCQALVDAIQAADLLGAVAGAVSRGDLQLTEHERAAVVSVEAALLAVYPPDPSQPDSDVPSVR
jgi:hypothetical protein